MRKFYLLIGILTMACVEIQLNAQVNENSGLWYWGVSSSITPSVDTELQSIDIIRSDNNDAWDDYIFDYVEGTFYTWNIGLCVERRVLNNKLALFSGLQYTSVVSGVDSEDYSSSDFMLINVSSSNETVEYLKVRSLSQNTHYIGVPIGLKYIPLSDHFVNMYIKSVVDINFLIDHKIDTEFVNASMEKYNSKVESLISNPTSVYTTFSFKGGVKLGKIGRPNINIEMGPTFLLSDDPSSITTSEVGFSFQLNVLLPF